MLSLKTFYPLWYWLEKVFNAQEFLQSYSVIKLNPVIDMNLYTLLFLLQYLQKDGSVFLSEKNATEKK